MAKATGFVFFFFFEKCVLLATSTSYTLFISAVSNVAYTANIKAMLCVA